MVVAVACNGSGGCICGSGCCTWWWQLHVMVAVVVYVVVVHIHIVFTLRHVHTPVTPMRALNADDQQCTMYFLMCICV